MSGLGCDIVPTFTPWVAGLLDETNLETFFVPVGGTFKVKGSGAVPALAVVTGGSIKIANGIEALAQMATHAISVVLLDINMPVMNGVQLVHRVRDDERLRAIPVIIASTEGSEPRIPELMQAGARGYVRKPFRPEQLRDALAPFVGLAMPTPSAVGPDEDSSSF